jgi:Tfp pilus assembly protein PilO
MKIDLKEIKTFTLPLFVVMLILIFSLTILRPKLEIIFKTSSQLNANKKTLTALTKKLATLEGLAKVELTDKTNLALDVLPAEKDVAGSLFSIKKIAYNNGLIVGDISISEVGELATVSAKQKASKNEIIPSFKVNVHLVGEVEKIKNFVSNLESNTPLMRISQISLNTKKDLGQEAIIYLDAFFLPFPASIGKSEQPLTAITAEEEKVFVKISQFNSFRNEQEIPNLPVGKENLFAP